VQQLARY